MTLLTNPQDPSQRGPWPVGARTVTLGSFTAEVLYPGVFGAEIGKTKHRYDLRKHLPETEQNKIPDAKNPWQDCDCYAELEPDLTHGPYPVIFFIHGTAGFRTQSLTHMVHWASRGFIVISADHPGINLGDVLALKLKFGKQGEDLMAILKEVRAKPQALAFLADRMDLTRIAISGHSAGGSALEKLGGEAGVQVLIPMAAGGTSTETPVASTLILGGVDDGVVPYKRQEDGYASSPVKKRLVAIKKAGHLAFSDLCVIGQADGGLLKIAKDSGVEIPEAFGSLIETLANDGCKPGQLEPQKGWDIIHLASSAVLEETLHCSSSAATQFKTLPQRFPDVQAIQEQLQ